MGSQGGGHLRVPVEVRSQYEGVLCIEVKTGGAKYYLTIQHIKDVWIMGRYHFPVILARFPRLP